MELGSLHRFFRRVLRRAQEKPVEITLRSLCKELFKDERLKRLPDPEDIPQRYPIATSRHTQIPGHPEDNPVDLAVATINIFNMKEYNDLSSSQRSAIDSMRKWLDSNDLINCDRAQVKEIILFLSQAFFLKDLTPNKVEFGRFRFQIKDDGTPEGLGSASHYPSGQILILIDPRNWHVRKGVEDHVTAQLLTLFHECVHAYLYVCCCSHRHGENGCMRNGSYLWWPKTGHDIGWFHLAAGLESAVIKHLGLGVNLSVFSSCVREYEQGGRYSAGEWAQFFEFYSWEDIDGLLRKLSERDFRKLVNFTRADHNLAVVAVFRREYVKAKRSGIL